MCMSRRFEGVSGGMSYVYTIKYRRAMRNGILLTIILSATFWLPDADASNAVDASGLASAGPENVRTAVGDDGVARFMLNANHGLV
mgnify:CR=1 FL=1